MKFALPFLNRRTLRLKLIVGIALVFSILTMEFILVVGYFTIRKTSTSRQQNNAQETTDTSSPKTAIETAGGENGSPAITLKATPDRIAPGQSSTIDWTTQNADSCTASGSWSGPKNTIGNQNSGALNETQTYKLSCLNSNGSTSIEVVVTVDAALASNNNDNSSAGVNSPTSTQPSQSPSGGSAQIAPVLTLSIGPSSINAGGSATISWTTNGNASPAPTCSAAGSWSGTKGNSGAESVSPAAGSYSYTLTCTNSAGSDSKTVNLTVNPVSACGSGGSCSAAEVASHNSAGDCWVIIKYTASGGNGSNGNVYKIASSFFGGSGTHSGLPGAPSLSASSWCGKNISSTFNSKHSGGTRTDGSHNAIWWLTNNGNSLIGTYSGS